MAAAMVTALCHAGTVDFFTFDLFTLKLPGKFGSFQSSVAEEGCILSWTSTVQAVSASPCSDSRRRAKSSSAFSSVHDLCLTPWVQSPWRHRPSHHHRGDRGDVPGGAGGFGQTRGSAPDGCVRGDGGGGAQPGAHAGVGEATGAPFCMLLLLKWP